MPTMSVMEGAGRIENAGANTAASRGTAVTANASANTKGSYTQLIASTGFDANGIIIMLDDMTAAVDYLIDIAVGAAASEVVKISNLLATGGTGSIVYGAYYYFPIRIAAGSRISARCQCSTGGNIIRVSALLLGNSMQGAEGLAVVTPYGDTTADSGGISIDPGGTVNTKGSYTQITASTTYPIRFLVFAIGNQLNNIRTSQSWLVDIAVGAAASEVVKIPNIPLNCSTSPDIITPQTMCIPVNIPAGTRLSVRAMSDGNDATDRLFDIVLYGVY